MNPRACLPMLAALLAALALPVDAEPKHPVPLVTDAAGYSVSLAQPVARELLSEAFALRRALRERRIEISERLATQRFGAVDLLITAIAPGGLLYATYKKQQEWQLEQEAAQIGSDLDALAQDLRHLQRLAGEVEVALGH